MYNVKAMFAFAEVIPNFQQSNRNDGNNLLSFKHAFYILSLACDQIFRILLKPLREMYLFLKFVFSV